MPEDVFVYLGQCLRDAREECGLTQQELADQTGRGLRHLPVSYTHLTLPTIYSV